MMMSKVLSDAGQLLDEAFKEGKIPKDESKLVEETGTICIIASSNMSWDAKEMRNIKAAVPVRGLVHTKIVHSDRHSLLYIGKTKKNIKYSVAWEDREML